MNIISNYDEYTRAWASQWSKNESKILALFDWRFFL